MLLCLCLHVLASREVCGKSEASTSGNKEVVACVSSAKLALQGVLTKAKVCCTSYLQVGDCPSSVIYKGGEYGRSLLSSLLDNCLQSFGLISSPEVEQIVKDLEEEKELLLQLLT